ncbi:MAG: replication initiator protein [Microvirus sp.]|nr:MAG: replication initiator protein [Microvirus sp.]
MSCYHPITAWYSATKNSSGKRSLVFAPSGGFGSPLKINCGACIGCRIERSRQWATRCMHESQLHAQGMFVTFTYSPENLPEDGSLNIRHLQLFFKKLRRRFSHLKIRYFACGEYGEEFNRPHYHALIWGLEFADKAEDSVAQGNRLFSSKILTDLWGLGFCTFGAITYESAAYVARYALKKVTGADAENFYLRANPETGELFQVKPEFVCMSLKPGIGAGWFDQFKSDVFPDDFIIHKGKKLRVPKYYDTKISPEDLEGIKASRKENAKVFLKHNTRRRLKDRETVKLSQLSMLKRTLK